MPRTFAAPPICPRRRGLAAFVLSLAACGVFIAPAKAIELRFDYSLDTSGFFGTAQAPTAARTALEFAGQAFEPFSDALAAIQPNGGDAWIAQVRNPTTGDLEGLPNLVVEQNVILVFAGARNLADFKLAEAGPGSYSLPQGASPSASFIDAVVNRGQGATAEDFAPWGGFIEFDTTAFDGTPRKWHYDLSTPPPSNAYDFYTATIHELAHLLGFGTSGAFSAQVSMGQFLGDAAVDLYGGPVPLFAGNQHWGASVGSPPYLPGTQPQPSLGPMLDAGKRKLFSPLDYAAMADIGWSTPPEVLQLPGDADDDQDVDGADLLAWQGSLGGFGGSLGDVNGDLRVDGYDGWIIRHNLGASTLASNGAIIPEPSGWLQAGVVSMVGLTRRRRRPRPAAGF